MKSKKIIQIFDPACGSATFPVVSPDARKGQAVMMATGGGKSSAFFTPQLMLTYLKTIIDEAEVKPAPHRRGNRDRS